MAALPAVSQGRHPLPSGRGYHHFARRHRARRAGSVGFGEFYLMALSLLIYETDQRQTFRFNGIKHVVRLLFEERHVQCRSFLFSLNLPDRADKSVYGDRPKHTTR